MRTLNIIIGLLLTGIILTGCTRKNPIIEKPAAPVGSKSGKGKATLKVTPRHHLLNIQAAKIYIKYNTLTRPNGAIPYDDSFDVAIVDGKPMAIIDSLTQGNYYLRSRGYDPELQVDVVGGAGVTVIDSLEKTYDIYLDVNEIGGH